MTGGNNIHKELIKAALSGNGSEVHRLKQQMAQQAIPAPVVVIFGQRPDGLYNIYPPPEYPTAKRRGALTVQEKNRFITWIEQRAKGPLVKIYLKEDEKDGTDGV